MKSKGQSDFTFLFLVLLLVILGVLFSYSASNSFAFRLTGDYNFFFRQHLIAVLIGFFLLIFAWRLNILILLSWYKLAILISIAALLLVFIPGIGKQVSGANRWVDIGIFSFQSSELAKIGLVLYLSVVLPLKKDKFNDFLKGTLPPVLIIGLLIFLIAIEPDISTSLLFLFVSLWLLFLAKLPTVHLLMVAVVSLPFFLILMEAKKYVVRRFVAFDPFSDPFGHGYHLIQSFISFQNGSWWGMGPGKGTQKIRNLPDAHTDFIFSIIGEELGLLGAMLVLSLFIALIYRGILIALKQTDLRMALFAQGVVAFIGLEVVMHVFVTLGLFPTTGLPLPFISYGRTSMVVHLLMAGLMMNLSRRS